MSPTPQSTFAAAMAALMPQPPARVGLAVSGGSDSTALLHLARRWAPPGIALSVATVDHGLRPESAAEAEAVARQAAALELPHSTLRWQGWEGQGNLQAAARSARYALLAGWATRIDASAVLLGHTADDQAETVLLELARGAGIDGLAAMAPDTHRAGIRFLRPLLSAPRADLRAWLRAQQVTWADDPSNDDPRFARIRVREALCALAPLGIDVTALATAAARLQAARSALDVQLSDWADRHIRQQHGDLIIAPDAIADLPTEQARRLLSQALRWVAGRPYPPRGAKIARLLPVPRAGKTLHGCLIRADTTGLRLSREPEAVASATAPPGTLWDNRWLVSGPFAPDQTIGATRPEGLAARPEWRATGLPRATLLAAPAIWKGDDLIAAPLIDNGPFHATIVPAFHASIGANRIEP